MPYIHFTEEQKNRAASVDLEEFLRMRGEKLTRSGREKRMTSDHSVTIRGSEWYDHATEKGGGPISFVRDFYGLSYPEAVSLLLDGEQGVEYPTAKPQEEEPPKAGELMLTYEQFGDSIVYTDYGNGDEVKRVVFNTRQVDYTYQQVVTLTLTNIGDEEVKGLYVDLDSADTYFTILSQPAPNLAPGASTTFRISYVPNLQVPASSTDPDEFTYLDENIRVIDGQGRELKKFEAELTVTKKPVYKVTLVVRPEDLSMGTAGFVTGVDAGGAYDDTAAGSAYAEGKPVWVLTTREDQYELIELDESLRYTTI